MGLGDWRNTKERGSVRSFFKVEGLSRRCAGGGGYLVTCHQAEEWTNLLTLVTAPSALPYTSYLTAFVTNAVLILKMDIMCESVCVGSGVVTKQ